MKKSKMLTRMMIGMMALITLSSCNVPTIKAPVDFYIINTRRDTAAIGQKNFNIKSKPDTLGEWIKKPKRLNVDNAPADLACFSLEDWLTIVKPKLYEGAKAWEDFKD